MDFEDVSTDSDEFLISEIRSSRKLPKSRGEESKNSYVQAPNSRYSRDVEDNKASSKLQDEWELPNETDDSLGRRHDNSQDQSDSEWEFEDGLDGGEGVWEDIDELEESNQKSDLYDEEGESEYETEEEESFIYGEERKGEEGRVVDSEEEEEEDEEDGYESPSSHLVRDEYGEMVKGTIIRTGGMYPKYEFFLDVISILVLIDFFFMLDCGLGWRCVHLMCKEASQ